MNPKKYMSRPLPIEIQVSFQRDHLKKALQRIAAGELSAEELREFARKTLSTMPAIA